MVRVWLRRSFQSAEKAQKVHTCDISPFLAARSAYRRWREHCATFVAPLRLLFGVDLKTRHAGNADDEGRLAASDGEFRSKRA
jgi:hypothetical protein